MVIPRNVKKKKKNHLLQIGVCLLFFGLMFHTRLFAIFSTRCGIEASQSFWRSRASPP